MPKAKVFPVPVRAWPIRSWPSRATGSVSAWIGKVVVMPCASRAAQMGSAMPKSRNVLAVLARFASSSPSGGSSFAGLESTLGV
jgi:hypothetical protein